MFLQDVSANFFNFFISNLFVPNFYVWYTYGVLN